MERRGRDVLTEFERIQQEERRKDRLREELYAFRGPNGEIVPRSKIPRIVEGSEPDPRSEIMRQAQQQDQPEDQVRQADQEIGLEEEKNKPLPKPPKGPAIHRSSYTGFKKIIRDGEDPRIYPPLPSIMIENALQSQAKVQKQEKKRPIIPPSEKLDKLLKRMTENIKPPPKT